MTGTVLVVAGGPPSPASILDRLPQVDVVVAADSGVDNARALGLVPTLVVGDMDSVSADGAAWLNTAGVEVRHHPVDKDHTDLELALDIAVTMGDTVVVLDSGDGRPDHALANLLLLAAEAYADARVSAVLPDATVTVVRGSREFRGLAGDLLTLLPVGGPAVGVTTEGLRWRLDDATIEPGSTHGVSNVFVATEAAVTVTNGVLLAIQPDAD